MSCTSPILISTDYGQTEVRCKQCLACRILRQSGLTLRNLLEFRMASTGEFWTFTYSDPPPDTLDYKDFSSFLKRYRASQLYKGNHRPIRYCAVGEYGSKSGRPHFHALIYNGNQSKLGLSRIKQWPHGFVYIGQVTPSSIRYTARYTLKFEEKGREAMCHWSRNPALGEIGIRWVAAYMRKNKIPCPSLPSTLQIENKRYYVDDTMKKIFKSEYGYISETHPLNRHMEYLLKKKLEDPVAIQRQKAENHRLHLETARFVHEQI